MINRFKKVEEIIKQHFGANAEFSIKGNERGNGRPDAWILIKDKWKLVEIKDWYDRTRPNQKSWCDLYFRAHGEYPLVLYRAYKGQTSLFNSYKDFDAAIESDLLMHYHATQEEIDYIMMHVADGADAIAKALGRTRWSIHGLIAGFHKREGIRIHIRRPGYWKPEEDEILIRSANEGKSITETTQYLISLGFKRDRTIVRYRARTLGIKFKVKRTGHAPLKIDVEKARHLYLVKKLSVPKISKLLNVSYPVIYNRLRDSGIAFRVGANQFSYA